MKRNFFISLGLLLGVLVCWYPKAEAGWEWESGAKAGYSSNLDRAVTNPQSSPFLSAFLSLNREPEGNSQWDWFLLASAEGTVFFNLSDLNALSFTLAPGLTYDLSRTWAISLAPLIQAKTVVDSDQSALALGGKIRLKQKWGEDFYTGQYYLYKNSRANVDTYSFTENALGFFLGMKLSAKLFGEIGAEFSRSDSFRAVAQQTMSGSPQGRGNGNSRRYSQTFGSDIIRENVDRQALGLTIGYDWTKTIFSLADYTFTNIQGDSGNSSDHSIYFKTGYRF